MFKRIVAAAVAVALGAALSLVGATAAQAHTADFNVTAVCNTTTGNYDLTGHLTLANVPAGVSGHVVYHVGTQSFSNNWNGSTFTFEGDAGTHGNGTFAFALPSIPGTTSGTGPWTYVYTTFDKGDPTTIKSDNQASGLTGTCSDTPDSKKITFCHYDNGQGGKYTSNTTSLAVFYQAGHLQHGNDIFPAGSYTKNGVTHTWAAQGDQSLLTWNNCLAVDAAAGISVSTPTCQSASVATWTGLVNATGGTLDQTPGTHSGIATATAHHAFPAGAGVSGDGSTKTISYTIVAATSGSPCWPADATASVTVTPPTCTTGDVVTGTFETPSGGSVTTSGPTSGPGTFTATFTAPTGHKFPAGPNVTNGGVTLTITVQLAGKDTTKCPSVVPQAPVVKDLCGTDNDHYGLPTGPDGVTYTRDGKNIIATHGADLQWGTLPAGWVLNQDGTLTFAFSNTQWTDVSCIVPDATASVTVAPPTCSTGSVVTGTSETPAGGSVMTSGPTSGPGIFTATFTAPAGHKFPAGPDVSADGSTFTITVQLLDKDTTLCPAVVPQAPVVKDLCGTDNDHYGLPTGPDGVTYTRDGKNIVATHGADLQWGALPDGWVLNQDGTLTFAFSNTKWNEEPCIISIPSSVSHTDQSCDVDELLNGSITVGPGDHVGYVIKDSLNNVVPFDATTRTTGLLAPGTYSVTATADAGYSLDPDVSGNVVISPYGDDCGKVSDSVVATASVIGQKCFADDESASLIGGSITVDLTTGGIDYTITRDSDATHTPIPFSAVTGTTTTPLDPGSYTVNPTAKAGFVLANPGAIPEVVTPYDGVCKQLVTHATVDPDATQVQLGCKTAGSYTLSSDQLDPAAVKWTVNGSPVNQDKYLVTTAGHYVIDATPGDGFGFDGLAQTKQWVFDFAVPTTCELKTLALTGTEPVGFLFLAALLTLFGVVLVRKTGQGRKNTAH